MLVSREPRTYRSVQGRLTGANPVNLNLELSIKQKTEDS